jgi:hypothetical protein
VDKAQEKIIGITRYECGEQVLPGIDAKVNETVLNMEELLVKTQNIKAMKGLQVHQSSGPFNESSVPVDHMYVQARLAMHQREVWVLDRSTDNILQNSRGELMPPEFLRYQSIGHQQNWEYGNVYYDKSHFSVRRAISYATGGVPVGTLCSLPKQLVINKATQHVLMTSLSTDDLKKACKNKKEPLISEIMSLHWKLATPPDNATFTSSWLKKKCKSLLTYFWIAKKDK